MQPEQTQGQQDSASRPIDELRNDPSVISRAITASVIGTWPKGSQPKRSTIASLRARLMNRLSDPIGMLYRLACGAIDEGKSAQVTLRWVRDFTAAVEAYAARHHRRLGIGVLPFHQVHARHQVAAIREDAEADCAEAVMNENDVASLETARAERWDAITAELRKLDAIDRRIAELRMSGR